MFELLLLLLLPLLLLPASASDRFDLTRPHISFSSPFASSFAKSRGTLALGERGTSFAEKEEEEETSPFCAAAKRESSLTAIDEASLVSPFVSAVCGDFAAESRNVFRLKVGVANPPF